MPVRARLGLQAEPAEGSEFLNTKRAPLQAQRCPKRYPGNVLLYRQKASTIGATGLNYSVRNGKRCCPRAVVTRKFGAGMEPAVYLT